MNRRKIAEIIAEMQKEGADVHKLAQELMEAKKQIGDPIPDVDSSKLKGKFKLTRKQISAPKKRKSRKKSSRKADPKKDAE